MTFLMRVYRLNSHNLYYGTNSLDLGAGAESAPEPRVAFEFGAFEHGVKAITRTAADAGEFARRG